MPDSTYIRLRDVEFRDELVDILNLRSTKTMTLDQLAFFGLKTPQGGRSMIDCIKLFPEYFEYRDSVWYGPSVRLNRTAPPRDQNRHGWPVMRMSAAEWKYEEPKPDERIFIQGPSPSYLANKSRLGKTTIGASTWTVSIPQNNQDEIQCDESADSLDVCPSSPS